VLALDPPEEPALLLPELEFPEFPVAVEPELPATYPRPLTTWPWPASFGRTTTTVGEVEYHPP